MSLSFLELLYILGIFTGVYFCLSGVVYLLDFFKRKEFKGCNSCNEDPCRGCVSKEITTLDTEWIIKDLTKGV